MFLPIANFKYNLHLQIQLFMTLMSDQDPDPYWFGYLGPDPDFITCREEWRLEIPPLCSAWGSLS